MKYKITAYPYAIQYGTIEVPDDLPEGEVRHYIEGNWGEVKFGEPELYHSGTDFDKEKEQCNGSI